MNVKKILFRIFVTSLKSHPLCVLGTTVYLRYRNRGLMRQANKKLIRTLIIITNKEGKKCEIHRNLKSQNGEIFT